MGWLRRLSSRRLAATALPTVFAAKLVLDPATYLAGPSADPPAATEGHEVTIVETKRIVPSEGLDSSVDVQQANNNLDVARFEGRVYLAFRSAPSHFSSEKAVVHVVSSEDERTWRHEARFAIGRDLREPRLLVWNGTLFLYVAHLGTSSLAFEPRGVFFSQREPDGRFCPLAELPDLPPDAIVWRTKLLGGRPAMLLYSGGSHLYTFDGTPMEVELRTTRDGIHWAAFDPDHPVVYSGGGSETDVAMRQDGTLEAIVRNEAGDNLGSGSSLCRASAEHLGAWTCVGDRRKFDSPFTFTFEGETYLIGRRHLTEDGAYDRGFRAAGRTFGILYNEVRYIWSGKRCSLWRIPHGSPHPEFVVDLPSRGDTCFASALPGNRPDEWVVYDYSSDVHGPDVVWNVGQRGDTYIYRHVLRFASRKPAPGQATTLDQNGPGP